MTNLYFSFRKFFKEGGQLEFHFSEKCGVDGRNLLIPLEILFLNPCSTVCKKTVTFHSVDTPCMIPDS